MIKAVVFDLWGTLATKNMSVSGDLWKHFGLKNKKKLSVKYEKAIQLRKYRNPESLAREFMDTFKLEKKDKDILFIVRTIKSVVGKSSLLSGRKVIVENLHGKYKVGILSNTSVFESGVLKKLGIEKYVDASVFSWQIGTIKPNRNNFKKICEKLGVSFGETLFIDDDITNVLKAKNLGMKTIHCKGQLSLGKKLKIMGIV